ncbi:hypothetical protein FRC12_019637 [Ceratobasidium sp. 428]|nr:hypothetical protein FRC12_019637 [Ceratobasidium sp. 428]
MSDSSFSKVTEEGVLFESPFTGEPTMLTPEESMAIQHSIGADIMMQLDDVVSSLTTGPRVEEAMVCAHPPSVMFISDDISSSGDPSVGSTAVLKRIIRQAERPSKTCLRLSKEV